MGNNASRRDPSDSGKAVTRTVVALFVMRTVVPFVLVVAIMLPMIFIMGLPNAAFGYPGTQFGDVSWMTGQAKLITQAFMSLPEYETVQINRLITVQSEGKIVTVITIRNKMTVTDLMWIMAIGGVKFGQDLRNITPMDVIEFYASTITITPLLIPIPLEEITVYMLIIIVTRKTPAEIMLMNCFDDQRETWSETIFNTLSETNALKTYPELFPDPPKNHGWF